MFRILSMSAVLTACAGLAVLSVPAVDAVFAPDGYAHMFHAEKTGMILQWKIIDTVIYIGVEAPRTGWVALNFMPMNGLIDGDTVIGYVDGETQDASLCDQVAPGNAHFPHIDDRKLGAKVRFLGSAGSEQDDKTIIDFSRALVTSENTDVTFMDMEVMTMIAFLATADDDISYYSKT